MRFAVTVLARSLLPERGGRPLIPEPRMFATLKSARAWLDMSRATFAGALLPTEADHIGLVLDDDGSEFLTREYPRDPDLEPIELDSDELREMKSARRKSTAPPQSTEEETTP